MITDNRLPIAGTMGRRFVRLFMIELRRENCLEFSEKNPIIFPENSLSGMPDGPAGCSGTGRRADPQRKGDNSGNHAGQTHRKAKNGASASLRAPGRKIAACPGGCPGISDERGGRHRRRPRDQEQKRPGRQVTESCQLSTISRTWVKKLSALCRMPFYFLG
jgi:hypothetical protein